MVIVAQVKKYVVIVAFLLSFMPLTYSQASENMDVHFINVGQGDSMFIETPSGQNILIDGGPPEAGEKVVKYLKERGIDQLDLLIVTHPDKDHIGGLLQVMDHLTIKKVIDSGKIHTTKTYEKYIDRLNEYNIPVEVAKKNDYILSDDELTIEVLNSYQLAKSNNDSSIVLKIHYKDVRFLLLGDVERQEEKRLTDIENLEADIIKVAHHGSKTSSSIDFLHHVHPQIAVLTYSKNNEFGHPVNRVIRNLNKVNALIYSTAVFGDIVIQTDGDDYFIFPEKSPIDSIFE